MDVLSAPPTPSIPFGLDMANISSRVHNGDPKAIEALAVGFEGLFSSLLVKEMRQTLEPGSLFGADQGDVLGGLFDHYLGEHLAQARSLGIADLMRKQLTKLNKAGAAESTSKGQNAVNPANRAGVDNAMSMMAPGRLK